jgi:hypothetical protein
MAPDTPLFRPSHSHMRASPFAELIDESVSLIQMGLATARDGCAVVGLSNPKIGTFKLSYCRVTQPTK